MAATLSTYKVIDIICLAACIAVGKGIVRDKINLMLVDKVNI